MASRISRRAAAPPGRIICLVGGGLLLAFIAASCQRSGTGDRPGAGGAPAAGIDVLEYEVGLRVDPDRLALEGTTTVVARRTATATSLVLELDEAEVTSVKLDGVSIAPVYDGHLLRVPLPPGTDSKTVRISVAYRATPATGLYAGQHEGHRVVYTDAWPYRGRSWLPGIHHPADPARLALTLDLPEGPDAVATGVLVATDSFDGRVRRHWRLAMPAPTYTFAFAIGDFATVEGRWQDSASFAVPVTHHLLAGSAADARQLDRTPAMIAFFSELLGPYPFERYASVQVPFAFAGMENASLAFLNPRLFEEGQAEATQVHEVAHQWFGNEVVLARWSDLWLVEGSATYLATLFYEAVDGPDAARRLWTEMADFSPARERSHRSVVPDRVSDPEDLLGWVPYDKGASILHLIRLTLGDEHFREALGLVVERHADRPLSTEAFREILEEVSGKSLEPLFRYWVHGDELPELATTWDADRRMLSWEVRGDHGTLDGVPFELAVLTGGHIQYLPASAGHAILPHGAREAPGVRPVGIMLRVR